MHHDLKSVEPHFDNVVAGIKPMEIRRNDRDFQPGDTVTYHQVRFDEDQLCVYTGKASGPWTIGLLIRHEDFPAGIKPGFCVFAQTRKSIDPALTLDFVAEEARMLLRHFPEDHEFMGPGHCPTCLLVYAARGAAPAPEPTYDRLEQIRRSHASAKPTRENPAWMHTHDDLGYVLGRLAKLEAK